MKFKCIAHTACMNAIQKEFYFLAVSLLMLQDFTLIWSREDTLKVKRISSKHKRHYLRITS